MKVAILGWGSLVWDPRKLPYKGTWQSGGPLLPLEFSRVSQDARLTLVIDKRDGCTLPVRFAISTRRDLGDAVADLRDREGTVRRWIGFTLADNSCHSRLEFNKQVDVVRTLAKWCESKGFDAAVWTALLPQFQDQTRKRFSIDNAIGYLRTLPKGARQSALDYFQKAPQEVDTPLRKRLRLEGLIAGDT